MNLKNNEPEALIILGVLFLYMIGGIGPFTALPWFAYLIIILPIYSWSIQKDDDEARKVLTEVERQKTHLLAAKTSLIQAKAEAIRARRKFPHLQSDGSTERNARTDLLKAKTARVRADEEAIRAETAILQKAEAVKDKLDKEGS